jgi:hypothetical protein
MKLFIETTKHQIRDVQEVIKGFTWLLVAIIRDEIGNSFKNRDFWITVWSKSLAKL